MRKILTFCCVLRDLAQGFGAFLASNDYVITWMGNPPSRTCVLFRSGEPIREEQKKSGRGELPFCLLFPFCDPLYPNMMSAHSPQKKEGENYSRAGCLASGQGAVQVLLGRTGPAARAADNALEGCFRSFRSPRRSAVKKGKAKKKKKRHCLTPENWS